MQIPSFPGLMGVDAGNFIPGSSLINEIVRERNWLGGGSLRFSELIRLVRFLVN